MSDKISWEFKIKEIYSSLRPSERKTADFILDNIKSIPELSIIELSNSIKVSQPTIIRFVKALGFKGYRDFKDAIIKEVTIKDKEPGFKMLYGFEVSKNEEVRDVPSKVIGATIRILEETLKSIFIDEFEKAVDMIVKAKRVDIYCVENSLSVATDLTSKLLYLGINVRMYVDTYMQIVCAGNLTEEDLAIGISYSGASNDTVKAMKLAKKSKAKTIGITNFEEAIINKYSDVSIVASNSKNVVYGNAIFSRSSQTAIVDMIYMGVILSDYEKYSKILDKNSSFIKDRGSI